MVFRLGELFCGPGGIAWGATNAVIDDPESVSYTHLAALNKLYASDKFEFVVIYGRRRVGKTALISRFIEDKNAIYFMGVESNAKQNLENFSKSILSFHTGMEAETSFLSFQAALEYVFKLSEKERIILAIDEYPYVARSLKSLASTIQMCIRDRSQ